MKHTFNTVKTRYVTKVKMSHVGGFSDNPARAIARERQFCNVTPQSLVGELGNPLTTYLLRNYFRPMFSDYNYHALLINTYIHFLPSEGLYPNQPIWHCDYARQEDVENTNLIVEDNEDALHWYIIIGDKLNIPMPQFIDKRVINLEDKILEKNSWVGVSKYIDRKVRSGWNTYAFKPFEIFSFRGNELYRSSVSTESCNRFAMRVTLYPKHNPNRPRGNGYGHRRHSQTIFSPAC